VDKNGLIRSANPAACSLLGYGHHGMEGLNLGTMFSDEALGKEFLSAGEARTNEIVLKRQGGERIPVLIGARPLGQDFNGERIVTAKGLQAYKRSDVTKVLEKMYYELATQYKTPLSLAFTWLGSLRDKLPSDLERDILEKTLRQLAKIELTFDRLALFDKSRLSPPFEPRLLEINSTIKDVINELPGGDALLVELRESPCSLYVHGDLFQLAFIVRTILSYFLRCSPAKPGKRVIKIEIKNNQRSVSITLQGPSISLDPQQRSRHETDPAMTRALWEMALGRDSIIFFMQNHRGTFDEHHTGSHRRIFHLKIPLVEARKTQ
jgi:hypothetical protein